MNNSKNTALLMGILLGAVITISLGFSYPQEQRGEVHLTNLGDWAIVYNSTSGETRKLKLSEFKELKNGENLRTLLNRKD